MIRVNVNLVSATITETETLTSGRVGLECGFTFSDEWDGLSKIAVFEGAESMDVPVLTDDTVVVPHECLSSPGAKLRVGVYGMNGDGDIVIPTVFASAGRIQQGAEPSGVSPADPTPSWAAQVQAAAASALEKATAVENEAASGDFDGADGADGADGVSPTVSVTAITGGHKVTVTDAGGTTAFDVMDGQNGADGQDGQDGADGVGVPSGGTTGQVLKKKSGTDYDTEWADESGGGGGGPSPYTSNPAALGTASPGSSSNYSRGDHVHPKPSASDLGVVAANQGAGNAGKWLKVDTDGSVITADLPVYSGGVS